MFLLKVATFFLVALVVGAEKKIELQDIEEDNLRSELKTEQEKEVDKSDSPQISGSGTGPGYSALDFMKSGILRYFDNSQSTPQQPRYVQQYAVTEQPERQVPVVNKPQLGPRPQQAMVGYLSNIPMQIYLVPQYYSQQSEQSNHLQVGAQHQAPGLARTEYQLAPEAIQPQSNYIDVPTYVPPAPKTYVQHYAPPQTIAYVNYPSQPPTPVPQATVAPVVAYQLPVFHYNPALVTSSNTPKEYYSNVGYNDANSVDEVSEQGQKQFSTQPQPEGPYQTPEFPRHYNSRTPIREEYRQNTITELPHPHPLLIKAPPPHLAHIAKSLPMYRPLSKPVYQGTSITNSFTSRPHEHYGPPQFKRRPSSLLESYIPSGLQIEYLKRGLIKEPLAAYDALASGRFHQAVPRHYERGFLPNQMYHTAAGGVTYGHYKRTPKVDKIPHK